MTSRGAQVERAAMLLLEEALERPANERKPYIENRTDLDEDVRSTALALLEAEDASSFGIETGGAGAAFLADEEAEPTLPGYRFIRQLGRGGMGTVWLAERDTRDFTHKVAIKYIKPGVLIDTLVERFRRERQILARLNHPNIAHLHDGGETAEGQPYIVMEFIDGRTLREWIEGDDPALSARLDLFGQIADAVEFAHQNLIIHRDLTPNNVLVTPAGQAKLIDFGIARPQLPDDETAPGSAISGLSLTPGFAAPERASGLVSNTLTDIYSLGRILDFLAASHEEPELRAIAGKASAPEPEERFASVSDMVDEIDRFRSGKSVRCFSQDKTYRLGKFVRREWRMVAAGSALAVALVGGMVGTTWAYGRAESERATAERRFDQLRDLANFQIFELYDELDHVVGNTAARVALTKKAQTYLEGLASVRSSDTALQMETARGFIRLARIEGIPTQPNFGEPKRARDNLDRAEPVLVDLADQGVPDARAWLGKLQAYRSVLLSQGFAKPKEARLEWERAEKTLSAVPASERDWTWLDARRIFHIAALNWADLELDNAVLTRHANALEREIADWPKTRRGGYEERLDRAIATNYRAVVQQNLDTRASLAKAVDLFLAADRQFGAMEKDFPNDPVTLYLREWNAYYGYAAAATKDDMKQAGALLDQASETNDRLLKIEEADNGLVTFRIRLREARAEYYSNIGEFEKAITEQEAVVREAEAKFGKERRVRSVSDAAYGHAILASIYRKAGRRDGACNSYTKAEALMAELERRGSLDNYVAQLRVGVRANLARCKSGAPVSTFSKLDEA